jgi:enoyl-CoA hydratase/carnithine racemase
MGELVSIERGDGTAAPASVATIRLQRPPMNALNTQLQEELRAAAAELTADSSVRAVVIYGGEKVFAAGADVKEFAGQDHALMMIDAGRLSSSLAALAAIPKPVIAAVTGYALGGGGTQRRPRLIGPAKAKDLIYTGRFVAADEALAIGLVDVVVPAADVYSTALAMAAKFARGPALALASAKAAIDGGLDTDLANGLKLESHLFASLFATADREIGMRSFLESGPGKAVFTGTGDDA